MVQLGDLPQEILERIFFDAQHLFAREKFEWYGLSTSWRPRHLGAIRTRCLVHRT